jgi:hypothetical protein
MKSRVIATEGLVEMKNSHKIFFGKPIGKISHVDLNMG